MRTHEPEINCWNKTYEEESVLSITNKRLLQNFTHIGKLILLQILNIKYSILNVFKTFYFQLNVTYSIFSYERPCNLFSLYIVLRLKPEYKRCKSFPLVLDLVMTSCCSCHCIAYCYWWLRTDEVARRGGGALDLISHVYIVYGLMNSPSLLDTALWTGRFMSMTLIFHAVSDSGDVNSLF